MTDQLLTDLTLPDWNLYRKMNKVKSRIDLWDRMAVISDMLEVFIASLFFVLLFSNMPTSGMNSLSVNSTFVFVIFFATITSFLTFFFDNHGKGFLFLDQIIEKKIKEKIKILKNIKINQYYGPSIPDEICQIKDLIHYILIFS